MKWDVEIQKDVKSVPTPSPIITQKKPINRFILASGLVHVIAATAIIVSNQMPEQNAEKDLVEMDLSAPSEMNAAPTPAPVVEQAAPTQTQAPEAPVVAEAPKAPTPVPVVAKQIPQQLPAKKTPTAPAKPAAAAPVETPTVEESPVAVATNTQETEQEQNEKDQPAPEKIEENDKQVEQELAAKAKAEAAREEELKKQNEIAQTKAAAAEQAQKEEDARTAAAAALVAEKAKQAEAAKKAEEAALAAAAQQAANEKALGEASKNAGPGPEASEVRQLENLKQMPGNPRPQYDQEERLKGHKGQVAFQAFVTQEGKLTNFRLLTSTGHRNLDAKTLKALKQWKFYPGQEGWVELPFDWDLKGGPQEKPALLRRKVGQGQ